MMQRGGAGLITAPPFFTFTLHKEVVHMNKYTVVDEDDQDKTADLSEPDRLEEDEEFELHMPKVAAQIRRHKSRGLDDPHRIPKRSWV